MSFPLKAVDRLFDRLALTYGAEWSGKWRDVDEVQLKSMWAHELSAFSESLKAIGWALENLPAKCPNLIEFKNLCRQAPREMMVALDAPKADRSIVDAEMAKIAASALKPKTDEHGRVDYLAWAKRLKARHDNGEKLGTYQIFCFRKALGIEAKAAA